MNNSVRDDFLKGRKIGKAIFWHATREEFCPRSYSASLSALKVNEEFARFKEMHSQDSSGIVKS